MNKIAILYGPGGGNTEKAARMLANEIGEDKSVLMGVRDLDENDLMGYSKLIFGGPTVGAHTWSDTDAGGDWDKFLPRLYKMDLKGKSCAIFGLGDQVSYSFHFVDDIRVIADRLLEGGARLVGLVGTEGYHFEDSKAVVDGKFLGLPLDMDNEPELTLPRIQNWVKQLMIELQ